MASKIWEIIFVIDNKTDVKQKTQESVKQAHMLHGITQQGKKWAGFF